MSVTVNGSNLTFNNGDVQTYSGRILAVVTAQVTAVQTFAAGGTWYDISGASVSITPHSTSSKIFVYFSTMVSDNSYSSNSAYMKPIRILRNGSLVCAGDARGSVVQGFTGGGATYASNYGTQVFGYGVDSPASTSSLTYQAQIFSEYIPKTTGGSYNSGASYCGNTPTVLTVMEMAP
jgi:hypothetical protein